DNAAVVSLLFDPLQDDVRAGLCPILRIDVLEDDEVIEVLRNFQRSQFAKLRRTGVRRVRRPEQCGRATRYGSEQQLGGVQLKSNVLRPAERQVRMIISMVPDFVPLVHNSPNKPRVTLRVHTHQEKRGFYVRGFENVQDLWRPPRIRTVVKGDCDLMLAT